MLWYALNILNIVIRPQYFELWDVLNIEFKPRKAFARLGGSKLQEFQISNVICENDEDDVGGGDEGQDISET